MIGPVIIMDDTPEVKTKARLIEIYKNNVYKDVELYTYKHAEANLPDLKVGNAVSADNSEDMDGMVIARYVEFRDAQLRRLLRFALEEITDEYADDEITLEDDKYSYLLNLPESTGDNILRSIAEYIHRFLVFGALYDWYGQFGMAQAAVYGQQLDEIEKALKDLLRGRSIVKRPIQPFGPAKKMY